MSEKPITPFIPSQLDDAGLTPVQFRVLCHLWRRGETFSSAQTIASVCRIKRDTVFSTLALLEERGLIRRDARKGQTTIIQPVPFGGTPTQTDLPRLGGRDAPPQTGHDLPRLGGHKGYPTKAIPVSESKRVSKKRFSKPSVVEIQTYVVEIEAGIQAEAFFDYYETKGWIVGKSPMKDWKAAVRTWKRNQSSNASTRQKSGQVNTANRPSPIEEL